MDKTLRNTEEVLADILSGDIGKIRLACHEIIMSSQNEEQIRSFIPYMAEIRNKTQNLNMGGAIHPNKRFVKKVLNILKFYKFGSGCSCCLFGEEDNPEQYETVRVQKVTEKNNGVITIHYIAECTKCNKKYKVKEELYHTVWWDWKGIDE